MSLVPLRDGALPWGWALHLSRERGLSPAATSCQQSHDGVPGRRWIERQPVVRLSWCCIHTSFTQNVLFGTYQKSQPQENSFYVVLLDATTGRRQIPVKLSNGEFILFLEVANLNLVTRERYTVRCLSGTLVVQRHRGRLMSFSSDQFLAVLGRQVLLQTPVHTPAAVTWEALYGSEKGSEGSRKAVPVCSE